MLLVHIVSFMELVVSTLYVSALFLRVCQCVAGTVSVD